MKKKIIITIIILVLFLLVFIYFYSSSGQVNPITGKINPKIYGENCKTINTCENLIAIDCQSAVDGPLYYVENNSGAIIARCGGACFNPEGCPNPCPPLEWTCGPLNLNVEP